MLKYNIPSEIVQYYRMVFNDTNIDYRHYCDICWYIRQIEKRDPEKCTEKESQVKLFIEMFEN